MGTVGTLRKSRRHSYGVFNRLTFQLSPAAMFPRNQVGVTDAIIAATTRQWCRLGTCHCCDHPKCYFSLAFLTDLLSCTWFILLYRRISHWVSIRYQFSFFPKLFNIITSYKITTLPIFYIIHREDVSNNHSEGKFE